MERAVTAYRHPESIVETDWLQAHLEDASLRVLDCTVHLPLRPHAARRALSREEWPRRLRSRHIPGADFVDLQGELSVQDSPFSFTLPLSRILPPRWSVMAWAMTHMLYFIQRRIHVGDARVVDASRLWLRSGCCIERRLGKWQAEQRAVSTAAPTSRQGARFTPRPRPALFTDKDEVLKSIGAPAACTMNALSPESLSGRKRSLWPTWSNPGQCQPAGGALLEPASGTFRSAEELDGIFSSASPRQKTERVIIHCGGGIAATLNAFLMYQLGYENLTVYDNSMSEWATDPSLPMEVD
jgi:thiosulfate/3-mercaptopyruvate sulfurtransferase